MWLCRGNPIIHVVHLYFEVFSSPDLEAQVSFSNPLFSVVCLCVYKPEISKSGGGGGGGEGAQEILGGGGFFKITLHIFFLS